MQKNEQKTVFNSWLDEHKGILFKVTRAYAFTAHDQEDLFQEISIRVWKSIPDFRGEAKVSTWIYSVALYTAMAWSRKERKHEGNDQFEAVAHTLVANEQMIDPRLNWLYEQIEQLSEIDRSLCLLMLDGYSYAEIAELLGLSASNVGVKLHRIKKQLLSSAKQTTLVTNERGK